MTKVHFFPVLEAEEISKQILYEEMAQNGALRSQVLNLYKRLLRLSRTWESQIPSETKVERNYIAEETQNLFKANKNIQEPNEILEHVREAEARLTMAVHYRNPYPRPVNLPPKSYSKREGKKIGRAIEKKQKMSKPIYVKSIDDSVKK